MAANRSGPWIVIAMLAAGVCVASFAVWWHVLGPGARVREQLELRSADPQVQDNAAESPLTRPWTDSPASR